MNSLSHCFAIYCVGTNCTVYLLYGVTSTANGSELAGVTVRTHQRDESFQKSALKLNAPLASVVAEKTTLLSHLSVTTRTPGTPRPLASITVPKMPGCSLFQPSTPSNLPEYLCAGAEALPGGGALRGATTGGAADGADALARGESAGR
jgi:hypothetical protein